MGWHRSLRPLVWITTGDERVLDLLPSMARDMGPNPVNPAGQEAATGPGNRHPQRQTAANLNSTFAERLIAYDGSAAPVASRTRAVTSTMKCGPSPASRNCDRHHRPRWAVVAKSPRPPLTQGGAITLQVRGEQADANHFTKLGSRFHVFLPTTSHFR